MVIACVSTILHFHSQHSVQIVAIEGIQDFSQRNLVIQNPVAPFAMLNFPIFARKTLYMPSRSADDRARLTSQGQNHPPKYR